MKHNSNALRARVAPFGIGASACTSAGIGAASGASACTASGTEATGTGGTGQHIADNMAAV